MRLYASAESGNTNTVMLVIIWDAMLSSGANVIIWEEMLSSGANVIIWDEMLSSGTKCYQQG